MATRLGSVAFSRVIQLACPLWKWLRYSKLKNRLAAVFSRCKSASLVSLK